ncbi:MAG: hydratase [Alcaligenaceae bacterium]|nr:MAG: hydratase [Alcaligenaceae bacterium]
MDSKQTDQAVAALLPAFRDHGRLVALDPSCRPANRAEGYEVQAALLEAIGEPGIGWKIAATSAAGQKHIGVSGPLAGRLLQSRCLPDGATVSLIGNFMAVAEAEFAFRIGRDIKRVGHARLSVADVMQSVEALHVAIEVPASRFEDFATAGEAQLISEFACACFFVLGKEVTTNWRNVDLKDHQVKMLSNGKTAALGQGANVLGDPRLALTWLANELLEHDNYLQAGDVVMTGTCLVPVPVKVGDEVTADFGSFGSLSAKFS